MARSAKVRSFADGWGWRSGLLGGEDIQFDDCWRDSQQSFGIGHEGFGDFSGQVSAAALFIGKGIEDAEGVGAGFEGVPAQGAGFGLGERQS